MKKHVLLIVLFVCVLALAGCSEDCDRIMQSTDGDTRMEQDTVKEAVHGKIIASAGAQERSTPDNDESEQSAAVNEDEDWIVTIYGDIYEEVIEAEKEGQSRAEHLAESEDDGFEPVGNLNKIQGMVHKLGAHGYPAVDRGNQVDMENTEQVLRFCEKIDKKKEDKLTVLVVETETLDFFTIYQLSTKMGAVEVCKAVYQYNSDCFEKKGEARFPVDLWQQTKEGYLIFTGSHYSEESFVLTMSDVPEVIAWRVEPLDIRCREMNRRYILPVGYSRNNLFVCDWSEEEYRNLDFYDLFDRFYPMVYGQTVPYVMDEEINVGAVYQIPEAEFERVVMLRFSIDRETLHTVTRYLPESKAYDYRPRGFHEVEYSSIPYPEVVDYTENVDGTVTLTVNAVYPEEATSKAFTHQVVIRPVGQDGFQYVSNEMLPSEDDLGTGWHTDRLTEEEWEEVYK